MSDLQGATARFIVLFTAQKLKKHKTWQDGTITYYSLNRKIVLTDEKGYNIDRKFSKSGIPSVGDEIEFDMHIVTVESIDIDLSIQQQQPQPSTNTVSTETSLNTTRHIIQRNHLPNSPTEIVMATTTAQETDYRAARRRLKKSNLSFNQPNLSQPRAQSRTEVVGQPRQNSNSSVSDTTNKQQQQSLDQEAVTTSITEEMPTLLQPTLFQPMSFQPTPFQPAPSQSIPLQNANGTTDRLYQTEHRSTELDSSLTVPLQQDKLSSSTFKTMPTSDSIFNKSSTNFGSLQQQYREELKWPDQDLQYREVGRNTVDETDQNLPEYSLPVDIIKRRVPAETSPNQKRIRVGLSKRTANSSTSENSRSTTSISFTNNDQVNSSTLSSNLPTKSSREYISSNSLSSSSSSSSSFMPASCVVVEDQNSAETCSSSTSNSRVPLKRFRVPCAEGISVPLVIQFPTLEKTTAVLKSKRLPKRTKVTPTQFTNVSQYKDIFRRMIHEHLQIMMMNNALHFHALLPTAKSENLERHFRSRGLSFYQDCVLKGNSRSIAGSSFCLTIRNRENSYKYGKDDIWVISKELAFDSSSTFLARSTFYGPSSNGVIEINCVTPRDARVATGMSSINNAVFALRTISAGTEFMMLDSLEDGLDRLPLLPNILKSSSRKKKSEPLSTPELAAIVLTSYDNINVQQKIDDTIRQYKLNEDQGLVLQAVAKSVIICPGWNEKAENPITLVHGVFGSGKSFLAATLIIFIRDIIDTANQHREPEDQIHFPIMISCFTNVAVDRILTILATLGYDEFVRVGSLKKIAKNLLPYTVKAKLSGNEEIKELEQMLEDPQNSEEDIDSIASAIQRFRRCENMLEVQKADVVGTTCSASMFEIFSESRYPFILMDECSQVMEPLTMVPLTRFKCSRMVMIGDPKQLPPTVATQADENATGLGLDKSLFSRLIEMGTQSIMLRTQYRCHPKISAISNNLFYDRQLLDGPVVESRLPLISGLPPLLFVDVVGNEQKSIGNSYWNQDEVAIAAHAIKGLQQLGTAPSDIGIISLYKEQADKIQSYLGNNNTQNSTQNIQISTVDAFQGAEKEIIILSTVRTSSSGFIDNHPRVNVALTRAKRHLIIMGNSQLLSSNPVWSKIIQECQGNRMSMHEFARYLSNLQTLDPDELP